MNFNPRNRWSVRDLESRLMLAGDAGAAVADAAAPLTASESTAIVSTSLVSESVVADAASIAFVAADVADAQNLLADIDADAVVLLDGDSPLVDQIEAGLANRRGVESVHIISHGEQGGLAVEGRSLTTADLIAQQDIVRRWQASLTSDADVLIYGCDVAGGLEGQAFVRQLAHLTGADVAASVDATGQERNGGDFDLEFATGPIDAALALDASAQQRFEGVLPIVIRAAGQTNEEEIIVEVDGRQVATINGIGGDALAGEFVEYTIDVDGARADQLRIAFVNDVYRPGEFDNNVRIDNVTIDGEVFEAESVSTFSTGTWIEGIGVTPGFKQSEFLHTNGAFTFDQLDDADVSQVRVFARGDFGAEAFEVRVDGLAVAAWSDIGTEDRVFSFETTEKITASQVQVVFVNDNFEPELGIDYNLIVDAIEVDGERFDTKAPTTFGTGIFIDGEIGEGFGETRTLFADGFFAYDQEIVAV